MSKDVDYEARVEAYTGLLITCIITTLLFNIGLIIQIFRYICWWKKTVLSCPRGSRPLILLSLAIGDIIFAFLPLTLLAHDIGQYEEESHDCQYSRYLAGVYGTFIVPFVYSLGLLLLTVERILFKRKHHSKFASYVSSLNSVHLNLMISVVPWVVALVVVLPLSLSYVDYKGDYCEYSLETFHKARNMELICVIIPVVATFFVAVASACIPDANYQKEISMASAKEIMCESPYSPQKDNLSKKDLTTCKKTPISYINTLPPVNGTTNLRQPNVEVSKNQNNNNVVCMGELAQSSTDTQPLSSVKAKIKERYLHLFLAVILCACCLPTSILNIVFWYDPHSDHIDSVLFVISDLVYWFFSFRASVMPCIWLLSGSFSVRSG